MGNIIDNGAHSFTEAAQYAETEANIGCASLTMLLTGQKLNIYQRGDARQELDKLLSDNKNALQRIEKLEADKAELLEALEKAKNEMVQCLKFLQAEGYEYLEFENLSEIKSLIQKHKNNIVNNK